MTKNVLIVEDEKLMQDLLLEYFINDGYNVLTADDGIHALDVFRKNEIDLVILDIMMPKLDGFSVCRKIRNESDALIIIVTAREEEDDKLLGYELGADDYVTKPFSPKILLAKASSLLQRYEAAKNNEEKTKQSKIMMKELIIDTEHFTVSIHHKEIALTKKEFDVLSLLVKNHKKVMTREQILTSVWGDDYFGDGRVVDTNIKVLRKKLGEKAIWIKTIVHVGYKFEM